MVFYQVFHTMETIPLTYIILGVIVVDEVMSHLTIVAVKRQCVIISLCVCVILPNRQCVLVNFGGDSDNKTTFFTLQCKEGIAKQ